MIKLTSIQNKVFNRKFRGYDVKQVRNFLNVISNRCAHLVHENENLTNKNDEYRYQIDKFASLRKSLSATMLEAQAAANRVKAGAAHVSTVKKAKADKYAKEVVASANQKADEILKRAVVTNNNLVTEINAVQKKAKSLKLQIGNVLDKQSKIFKSENINNIINKPIGKKASYKALRAEIAKPDTVVFMPDGSSHKF